MQNYIRRKIISNPLKAENEILNEREQMILLRLYHANKEVVKTSLLDLVPNSYSLEKCIIQLKKYNLIYIREEKIIRRTFYISITKKGYAISKQLEHIKELLKKDLNDFDIYPSFERIDSIDNIYQTNNSSDVKKLCQACMSNNPNIANFCMYCGAKLE